METLHFTNFYMSSNKSYSQWKEQGDNNKSPSGLKDLSKLSIFQGHSLPPWLAASLTPGSIWILIC